jgi:hypothetical protein
MKKITDWERAALAEVIEEAEAKGIIRDTGDRKDGKIVWIGGAPDDFTGKPWPRFVRDDNEVA